MCQEENTKHPENVLLIFVDDNSRDFADWQEKTVAANIYCDELEKIKN